MELDFGAPVANRGVRSDSRLPFKVEFSLDGVEWTASAAYYNREPEQPSAAEGDGGPWSVGGCLMAARAFLL